MTSPPNLLYQHINSLGKPVLNYSIDSMQIKPLLDFSIWARAPECESYHSTCVCTTNPPNQPLLIFTDHFPSEFIRHSWVEPHNLMMKAKTLAQKLSTIYGLCCRWDNSLLWDLPTESSFWGQNISPWPYHILHIILYIKLGKHIRGAGILDSQKCSKSHRSHLIKSG